MPIRPAMLRHYHREWAAISREVRFGRARGRCEGCARPHLETVRVLPDGRWFDPGGNCWRDARGRTTARWPDLVETTRLRLTRVVLAAAHLDGNPRNNRRRNLRCLCQRCHLLHDMPMHARQRAITVRRRYALGDLFLGSYDAMGPARPGRRAVLRRRMPALPPRRVLEARLPLLA